MSGKSKEKMMMQTIRTMVLGVGAPMLLVMFGVQLDQASAPTVQSASAVPAKGGNGNGNGGGGNGGGGGGDGGGEATCTATTCAPGQVCVDTPAGPACLLLQPITCATLDCAPGFICVDEPSGATCVPL